MGSNMGETKGIRGMRQKEGPRMPGSKPSIQGRAGQGAPGETVLKKKDWLQSTASDTWRKHLHSQASREFSVETVINSEETELI